MIGQVTPVSFSAGGEKRRPASRCRFHVLLRWLLGIVFGAAISAAAQQPPVQGLPTFVEMEAAGAVRVAFSVADRQPLTIDVVDVTGRRLASRTLDAPSPGAMAGCSLPRSCSSSAGSAPRLRPPAA